MRARAWFGVVAMAVSPAVSEAQPSFEVIRAFAEGPRNPRTLVEAPDGLIYGTTDGGGAFGGGAIVRYERRSDGGLSGTTLHSFRPSEGALFSSLVLGGDGALYGSACAGGSDNLGTLFKVTRTGTFTMLYSLVAADGVCPERLMLASDGNFYGGIVTRPVDSSRVFRLTPDGTFTHVASFGAGNIQALVEGEGGSLYGINQGTFFRVTPAGEVTVLYTFSYGEAPTTLLRGLDGHFYGTTSRWGDLEPGVVFRMTAAGSLTVIHTPTVVDDTPWLFMQAADGTLYGRTIAPYESGELFSLTLAGVKTQLHAFSYWDGHEPVALIQVADGSIFGVAARGGLSQRGVVFSLQPAGPFSVVYDFRDITPLSPAGSLLRGADGALYGTSCQGGLYNAGTVFRLTEANELTVLRSFEYWDGVCPVAGLTVGADGAFYGSAAYGGIYNAGSLFRITMTGAFTPLHFFNRADGYRPIRSLLLAADGHLYGVTPLRDGQLSGNIFRLSPAGSFSVMYNFGSGPNDDALYPASPLTQGADGSIYGMTVLGGFASRGTVFRMTSGGIAQIHQFMTEGIYPAGRLVQGTDGDFYGTTTGYFQGPVPNGRGTAFKLTPSGTLTTLHAFVDVDGANPLADLTQASDGMFYGTASKGGVGDFGTIFRFAPDGSFSRLHAFSGTDGAMPYAGLTETTSGVFYGVTMIGGPGGRGVVFRLSTSAAAR